MEIHKRARISFHLFSRSEALSNQQTPDSSPVHRCLQFLAGSPVLSPNTRGSVVSSASRPIRPSWASPKRRWIRAIPGNGSGCG